MMAKRKFFFLITNKSQWIMYSKWIMVYVLMTTNLFTLYLQDLNLHMHITVPVFGCLQNLIVNFKDHDYDILTD